MPDLAFDIMLSQCLHVGAGVGGYAGKLSLTERWSLKSSLFVPNPRIIPLNSLSSSLLDPMLIRFVFKGHE